MISAQTMRLCKEWHRNHSGYIYRGSSRQSLNDQCDAIFDSSPDSMVPSSLRLSMSRTKYEILCACIHYPGTAAINTGTIFGFFLIKSVIVIISVSASSINVTHLHTLVMHAEFNWTCNSTSQNVLSALAFEKRT